MIGNSKEKGDDRQHERLDSPSYSVRNNRPRESQSNFQQQNQQFIPSLSCTTELISSSTKPVQALSSCMKKSRSKKINWGEITIYEFPNILGDNPAVSGGSPITIGWQHTRQKSVEINLYEFLRRNNPRRSRRELLLKSGERDSYLLCLGYSLEELMKVTEAAQKIRESRKANMKNFHANNKWNKFVNVFELAAKGVMDNAVTNVVTKSIRVSIRVANDATNATLSAAASTLPNLKTAKSA